MGQIEIIQQLIDLGKLDEAERKLHEMVSAYPTKLDPHILLGRLYVKKFRPDLTKRHIDIAMSLAGSMGLMPGKLSSELLNLEHGSDHAIEHFIEQLESEKEQLECEYHKTRKERFESQLKLEEEKFGVMSSMMGSEDFRNFIFRYLPMIELDHFYGIERPSDDAEISRGAQCALVKGAFKEFDKFLRETRAFHSWEAHIINAFTEANDQGAILEFGVHKGGTINFIADYCASTFNPTIIHGFDSFLGIPGEWEGESWGHLSLNGQAPSVAENVQLHKGWFDETLPMFLNEHKENARLIHLDCDLETSTTTVLDQLEERIVPGTAIVFDDIFPEQHSAFKKFYKRTGLNYRYLSHHYLGGSVAILIQ